MTRWFLLAAAACSAKSAPVKPVVEPAVVDGGSSTAEPVATVRTPATRRAIEAPHGGAITVLAASDDGKAALSCDELGGLRLWPALDGSREPRVVDLPRPRQLAVGVRAGGYVVAALDEVGGIVVAQVDGDGLTSSYATLAAEPPFAAIAMTELGALAWRTDQVLMIVAPNGTIVSRLATEPGQRVIGLSVVNGRAIAAVESAGSPAARVRWLSIAPKLQWGGWIATRQEIGATIALAPGGKRFATLIAAKDRQPAEVGVVDIASGQAVMHEVVHEPLGLGFADDDHVALGTAAGVGWIDLLAVNPAFSVKAVGVTRGQAMGAGGGHVVSSLDGQLVVTTPTSVNYLGYDLQSPSVAAAGANGRLLIGVNDAFAMLDAQLHAVATPDLAMPARSTVAELRWLGGDAWIVESSNIVDGTTSLSIVDLARKASSVVRANGNVVHLLMHEPSTQLVTLSLGETPEVDRLDAANQRLDAIAVLPKAKVYEQTELVPVSPHLAGGTQVVAIHMRDQLKVQWLRDPKLITSDAGAMTVCCSLAAVDAAGHVYVWQTTPNAPLELAIYRDGKRVGKLPTEGPTAVWPEASGARILEIGQRSVSLYTSDGAKKWTQPVLGATEALWLDDGAIAIVTRSGLARLDAATGAITASRCGWRFGLSVKPHPINAREEPVCTAQR